MVKRLDVQGLRAVAVLAVMLFHAGLPLPGGFLGVDVFFVISGFVITGVLMKPSERGFWRSLGSFYVKRFKRLAPALAAVVVFTVALAVPLLSSMKTQQTAALSAIGASLAVANFVISSTTGAYFDAPAAANPLLNMWSLGVEEQFYFVFPTIFLLVLILARRQRARTAVLTALVLIAGFISFYFAIHGLPDGLAKLLNSPFVVFNHFLSGITGQTQAGSDFRWLSEFYSPVTRIWEFGFGALTFFVVGSAQKLKPALAHVFGIAGLAAIIASLFLLSENDKTPGWTTLIPVIGTALVIWSGSNTSSLASRALGWRGLVGVGDRSYSLYLWHWPLIVFIGITLPGQSWSAIVGALLAVPFAMLSFRFLENPVRHAKRMGWLRTTALVTLALILPVGASTALYRVAEVHWGSTFLTEASASHRGGECHGSVEQFRHCELLTGNTGVPVYLYGDSNAAMLFEGVEGAAELMQSPFASSSQPGCVFLDVYPEAPTGYQATCKRWYQERLAIALSAKSGIVVLAQTSRPWAPPPGWVQPTAMQYKNNLTQLKEGLTKTVTQLARAGHRVVVVAPMFRFEEPRTAVSADLLPNWLALTSIEKRKVSIRELQPAQLEVRAIFDRVTHSTGVELVTFDQYQCPRGSCVTQYAGIPLYLDQAHISSPFSVSLAAEFARAMTRISVTK